MPGDNRRPEAIFSDPGAYAKSGSVIRMRAMVELVQWVIVKTKSSVSCCSSVPC